jgi:hypothetical protein
MIDRRSRGTSAVPAAIAAAALSLFFAATARAEIATGPEVGETIPDIRTYDQHGKMRTFEDLRGPEGLLVLFYRTADW